MVRAKIVQSSSSKYAIVFILLLLLRIIYFYFGNSSSVSSFKNIMSRKDKDEKTNAHNSSSKTGTRCQIHHMLPSFGTTSTGEPIYLWCNSWIGNPMRKKWGGPYGHRIPASGYPLTSPGVLDFTPLISTSLRILVVGNSMSGQNTDALEEALCDHNITLRYKRSGAKNVYETNQMNHSFLNDPKDTCIREEYVSPENKAQRRLTFSRAISLPNGGILAHWGTMTMIHLDQEEWTKESKSFQGLRNATNKLLGISRLATSVNYDVFVYHIPIGHVSMSEVTEEALSKVVHLASELFRCSIVIFFTMPWNTDVVNDDAILEWDEKNDLIRRFARTFTAGNNSSVTQVQFVDHAIYSKQIIEANGASLGMSHDSVYKSRLDSRWKHLIAMACGNMPSSENLKECAPNNFVIDGFHWCPDPVHSRISAAQACILECLEHFPDATMRIDTSNNFCSEMCNARFMNLSPFYFPRSTGSLSCWP